MNNNAEIRMTPYTRAEQPEDDGHSADGASSGASTAPLAIPPKIARIIENLHTQDNRITANPMFAVQQKRVIGGLGEDYADAFAWICEEGIEAGEEEAARLDALHDAGEPIPGDWRRVGYVEKWEFVTGCLTEQGCKDYIACNGHNLKEPRIYAYGSYRNSEWAALREWLMGLRGQRAVEAEPATGHRITPDGVSPAPAPDLAALLDECRDALELGRDAAYQVAQEYHAAMHGYRPARHAAVDADVAKIDAAISRIDAVRKEKP